MILDKKFGPFEIEKELGSGAMGAVYLALYTKTNRQVAIKIIAPGLGSNETALARFEREGAILKQLKHPNIVRLLATGRHHGTPFYAMEYIEGESLDKVMARRGRITWEEVVTIGQQLCSALQHAHEQGIIHRDLKPSNLMMLADGTIKLTDFGIAKDIDVTQLTAANCTVGTAAYMSPEQCKGERNLTHKSDLYSMGVLFFELLTGRKPFVAETPMDMFLLHVNGKVERPSRLVLDIPVWLDTLVCQLLEKKPEHRPLDAATVAQSLNRIQEKVTAQQSAGIDAAKARAVDRPRELRLEEEDREAARTLLGRKARKRKRTPFYSRLWFRGAIYLSLLVGVSVLVYFLFIKRPSPEVLFTKAQRLMDPADTSGWEEARNGPIKDFLRYYPNHAKAEQMQAWADQYDTWDRERLVLKWVRNNVPTDPGSDATAREALRSENSGDFAKAREGWQKLLPLKKETATDSRSWGLLAEKRLRDLNEVEDLKKKLQEKVEQTRKQGKELTTESDAERMATEAIGLELDKKMQEAREAWKKLKKRYDTEDVKWKQNQKDRPWYLLATAKVHELELRVASPPKGKQDPK
jgi:serine/threonine-protein kinase